MIGLDINSNGTPTYIKIVTTIPVASPSADFTVNIKGFIYGAVRNADISISWHYYLSTFYNPIAKSSGGWAPTIRLSAEGGFVAIVLSSPGYWPKFYVESMYSSAYTNQYASGWSWTDADATGSPIVNVPYANNFGNGFVMLTDGNVGIGTTSPATLLHVDTVGADARIRVSAGTNTVQGGMIANTGTSLIYAGSITNHGFSLRTNDTDRVRIDTSGNVGIGTSTLFAKFVVSNGSGENVEFSPGSATYNGGLIEYINRTSGTTRPDLTLYLGSTTGNIKFHTNTTERMRISSDGYVGIGTTSFVYGAANRGLLEVYGSTDGILALRNATANSYLQKTGNDFYFNNGGAGTIFFQNNGSVTRMVVASSGNIGIGTLTPNAKLNVNSSGSLAAGSVVFRVEGSSGSLFAVDDSLSGSLFSVNDISAIQMHLSSQAVVLVLVHPHQLEDYIYLDHLIH